MSKWIQISLALFLVVTLLSCNDHDSKRENSSPTLAFNPETLKIPDKGGRKLRGQVLYMPVYSNIPYQEKRDFDLSAFLAIHNTDLQHQIKVTKVDFFNTEGRLVKSFIASEQRLNPLATVIFTVLKNDRSGTGANFLVEWMADQPVNAPLLESIMKDLSGNIGLSFLSTGRIIREIE